MSHSHFCTSALSLHARTAPALFVMVSPPAPDLAFALFVAPRPLALSVASCSTQYPVSGVLPLDMPQNADVISEYCL